jgi:hypothetical protein
MSKHTLKNHFIEIKCLTDAMRIMGLMPAGKINLLADMSSTATPPHFIR